MTQGRNKNRSNPDSFFYIIYVLLYVFEFRDIQIKKIKILNSAFFYKKTMCLRHPFQVQHLKFKRFLLKTEKDFFLKPHLNKVQ
jgi:hypothetical protein